MGWLHAAMLTRSPYTLSVHVHALDRRRERQRLKFAYRRLFTINRGAVFGLGQGQKWLFLGVSVVAIAFLSYLFATSNRQRFYQVILGMLLAGVRSRLKAPRHLVRA